MGDREKYNIPDVNWLTSLEIAETKLQPQPCHN